MSNAKDNFDSNIRSIYNSVSIYQYLENNAKNLDSTILLRSQFVLIVSALDTYVHSAVINKIIEVYFSQSNIELNVEVPLSLMHRMKNVNETMQKEMLSNYLNEKFSKDSFQSPKSIVYAYSILGIDHIWSRLSSELGKSAEDIKNTLALIVKRRNKIAHESDWNKITGEYEEIDLGMVLNCKEFVQQIVNVFDTLLYDIQ